MFFRQINDRKLAQYSYLIGCQATGEAIVIDPMRDVDQYVRIATAEGLKLVAAAETHIHADFLSGARELAERGLMIYVSGDGDAEWQSKWLTGSEYKHRILHNGDHFMIGRIRFDAWHTPGHTPEHMCYLVSDTPAGASIPVGLVSGDFVFVGDVGRPDLLESAAGHVGSMEPGARALYQSIAAFRALNPGIQLWPGHGAGSACGKALGAVPMSTVGYELSANRSIAAATDPEAFTAYILEGQPEPPLYFARMKRDNRDGPALIGEMPDPRLLPANKFGDLSGSGVAVLDTRTWDEYRHAHLPGALFTPLNSQFNTIAGCYVAEKKQIVLLVEASRLHEAIIDLLHVGLDEVKGYITPDVFREYAAKGKTATIAQIEPDEMEKSVANGAFLLDVRRSAELAESGFVAGAHNIAHTRLLERVAEVPRNQPVVIHCSSGSRSRYAAGLLDHMGYKVINVAGGFDAWKKMGGAVVMA
ncbi:MAG TPA: MBL fold metallo-hydrolase [Candidatus Krumholzibacteria bacterium]|nr:MBL fold metallo-hydrolase [Candidatus Krumholzibacteria bacterium]